MQYLYSCIFYAKKCTHINFCTNLDKMSKNIKKASKNQKKSKLIEEKNQYVLMADIINSSQYELKTLKLFRKKIDQINANYKLISPLTITLGDEFQGITTSLYQAVDIIFELEQELLAEGSPFKLRYSLGYGRILTPINSDIAHGMYGEALTATRYALESLKHYKRKRFLFLLPNKEYQLIFNNLFYVYQSFIDNWKTKDYELVTLFHQTHDYKDVAKSLGKSNDQIWRREKNLNIRQFFKHRESIKGVVNLYENSIRKQTDT